MQPPLPPPQRETFICSADGSCWPFLVQLPPATPQAILISLHGHYGNETQMMTEDIYEGAFGKLRRECWRRHWAYLCPWYGGNTWMGPLAEAGLADLFALLQERWPRRPIYLQGGSMGGTSALIFAVRRPKDVAGVIARCPAADIEAYYHWARARANLNPTLQNIANAIRLHYTVGGGSLQKELRARSVLQQAERLTMPVHLAHGAADELIPGHWTRALAEKLHRLGRPVYYEEIPDGNHDAPVRRVNWREALDFVSQYR